MYILVGGDSAWGGTGTPLVVTEQPEGCVKSKPYERIQVQVLWVVSF